MGVSQIWKEILDSAFFINVVEELCKTFSYQKLGF